ncbi:MAG: 2'-deoxycytidine 5'-triphosphate deaminase [Actinomycetota bacterium]
MGLMAEMAGVPDGIFPSQWLQKALAEGIIHSRKYRIPEESVQPASVDLRLGERAYRLRCSFLPETQTVEEKLDDFAMGEIDLRDGAILERNRPYLIPLIEELRLPPGLRAKTNPRSSTGRLDIFTRVITDRSHKFDEIAAGYEGKLYLEVVSRSFTIKVHTESSLNQVRLVTGVARCSDEDILLYHRGAPILFADGSPVPEEKLSLDEGLFLSLDLSGDRIGAVGYRAKRNSRLLDLSLIRHHAPADFWEPVFTEPGRRLVLEPEEFYLLLSSEAVSIPPTFAAEMNPYEPTSGELRTHYAGFFDPGFGYSEIGAVRGTRAVLEVRAHDVPFMVEHGQRVCKLGFESMLERPMILYGRDIGSSYQQQELTLSKHFKQRSE